jgi:hypothetical protein
MVKKSIAVALLVVMVAWAEMAMAPMFAMHVWYAHSAHDMAATMAAHHHAMAAGHACCPKIGQTESAPPIEFAASNLPCQNEHRCCFLQGPQSVPAPIDAKDRLSRDLAPAEIAEINPAQYADSSVSPAAAVAPGPPPGMLGMVLRV